MLGIQKSPSPITKTTYYGCSQKISSYPISKSEIIPITKETNTLPNEIIQHSLNENYFDPSKMSPPNDFMNKLQKRLGTYYEN